MSVFKLKEFDIVQQHSAMKVGTDSVLLGSLLETENPQNILDIGTGTGLLALMLAQRYKDARIDAVEIDEEAFAEATQNAQQSKWRDRVNMFHQSLQDFARQSTHQYDLIVSNPPYYEVENHYGIEAQNRSHARHTATLSFDELLENIAKLLITDGRCWMVLPKKEGELVVEKARAFGLCLVHQIFVFPNPNKPFNRLVFCLAKTQQETILASFYIKDESGHYSQQYKDATMPFLLWNKQ
ncbi:MAG: methyltransferase [Bacteroidota bacterium]